jgi:hypothetical protein
LRGDKTGKPGPRMVTSDRKMLEVVITEKLPCAVGKRRNRQTFCRGIGF